MSEKSKATVTIVLSVEMENFKDFMSDWESLHDRLIEMAGIESAVLTLPKETHTIRLER